MTFRIYDILLTLRNKKYPLAAVETRRCWLQPPWSSGSSGASLEQSQFVLSPPPGAFRHTEDSCLMPVTQPWLFQPLCSWLLSTVLPLFSLRLGQQLLAGICRAASESQGGWRTWLCPSSWLVWGVAPVGAPTEMLFLQFILCQL